MNTQNFFERIRHFDAYSKPLDDFRIKTFGGGAVTLISSMLMVLLFFSELNYYLTKDVRVELLVDMARGQKLLINLDITFPKISCPYLTVDAMDVSGAQQTAIEDHVYKQRLDLDGNPVSEPEKEELTENPVELTTTTLDPDRCESCYGAETKDRKCCNTCDEVKEQYKKKGWALESPDTIAQCVRDGTFVGKGVFDKEGCKISGYLEVNKVAGNFHIAPGKSYHQQHVHIHDIQGISTSKLNLSHTITKLSFGHDYPGMENPLDNMQVTDNKGSKMYQYYVKVVPTTYVKVDGTSLSTNQYSVTKHEKLASMNIFSSEQSLPGVFLTYELSPMMVKYQESQRSFMHFLTGVCAIIGGVFTVAGLVDSAIYHSSNVIRKLELGKAT